MCVAVGLRLYFMATVQHATRKVSSFAHTNTNTKTLKPNITNTKSAKLIAYTHINICYIYNIYICMYVCSWVLEQRRAPCICSILCERCRLHAKLYPFMRTLFAFVCTIAFSCVFSYIFYQLSSYFCHAFSALNSHFRH